MGTDHSTRIRVAIVDDSDDVRFLLATAMQVDGRFAVIGEAQSATEGLELVTDARPDLVLIDLQLGDHDGTALIRELRSRGEDAVISVVTASTAREELDAAMAAGADSVHNKMSMTTTMADELVDLVGARAAVFAAAGRAS
jgi:DNA-binding NarL/FixJ family response regulator